MDNVEITLLDNQNYEAKMDIDKTSSNIEVIENNKNASIKINSDQAKAKLDENAILDKNGIYSCDIVVTSESGIIKTYKLQIIQIAKITGKVINNIKIQNIYHKLICINQMI